MKTFFLLALTFSVSCCTYSDASRNIALGGRGAYKSKVFAVTWDNEKSFSDGTIAATAVAGLYYSAAQAAAREATARVESTNRSAEAINASNNAVKTTEILHPVQPVTP